MDDCFIYSGGSLSPKGHIGIKDGKENFPLKALESTIINSDYMKSLEFDGKGMMSHQTKLLMAALQLVMCDNFSIPKAAADQANVYVGSGPISLETRTVKTLVKMLLSGPATEMDFSQLANGLERLPPLDGIKMLSTAGSHFYSKELFFHGAGQPIYSGSVSGLTALCLGYEDVHYGSTPLAIVGSAEAPFFKHTEPYLDAIGKRALPRIECSASLLIGNESSVGMEAKPLCKILGCKMTQRGDSPMQEHLAKHYESMGVKVGECDFYSSNGHDDAPISFKSAISGGYYGGATAALLDVIFAVKEFSKGENRNKVITDISPSGQVISIVLGGVK